MNVSVIKFVNNQNIILIFLLDLDKLEELDLSQNKLHTLLDSKTFHGMKSLRVLHLNHNQLVNMANTNDIFYGLNLDLLDLSANKINPFAPCTFCGLTSLKHLNIANNHLSSFNENLLKDLADSLEELVLDNNVNLIDPLSSVNSILQPLKNLHSLSLVNLRLSEDLPASIFDNNNQLKKLNLSMNAFRELSSRMISPLTKLIMLDVSANQITFIDPAAFNVINGMNLVHIYLHDNPYSCYRCHILPFVDWINRGSIPYEKVCPPNASLLSETKFCARCASPSGVAGRFLHEVHLDRDLEFCKNPETSLRVSTSDPQVGVILGLLIIITLVVGIIVVIAIYRKNGAVYYTQEDKLSSNAGSPELGSVRPHKLQNSFGNTGRSLTSTNFTFSPQSSIEQQQQLPSGGLEKNHVRANSTVSTNHLNGLAANNTPQANRGDYACESCVNSPQVKQVIASLPAMTELIESHVVTTANNGLGEGSAVIMTTAVTKSTITGLQNGWSGGHANNKIYHPSTFNVQSNGHSLGGDLVGPDINKIMMGTPTSNNKMANGNGSRVALLNEMKLEFSDDKIPAKGEEYDDPSKVQIYI